MEIKEVFEPVLNFIKNLQKKDKEPASKQAAKDRLKLVLMQDRASVSPDFFEMMKREIIDVIKKYIEIDEEALEVQLTRGIEAGLEGPALYANIPIKNVKPVAPKISEDGEIIEEENGEDEKAEVQALSDEDASIMADKILNQIEDVALSTTKKETDKIGNDSNKEKEESTENINDKKTFDDFDDKEKNKLKADEKLTSEDRVKKDEQEEKEKQEVQQKAKSKSAKSTKSSTKKSTTTKKKTTKSK